MGAVSKVNEKKHYESTIIINGVLDDEAINQVVTRTTEFITRNGGEIVTADHWGRRRLAYPIDKKNNGYYVQFGINAPAEMQAQLERFYHLDEHIIRTLTLHLDELDLDRRDDMRKHLAAEAEAALAAEKAEAEAEAQAD